MNGLVNFVERAQNPDLIAASHERGHANVMEAIGDRSLFPSDFVLVPHAQ